MSDVGPTIKVNYEGNADQLRAELEGALTAIFAKNAKDVSRIFDRLFKGMGADARDAGRQGAAGFKDMAAAATGLQKRIDAIGSNAEALRAAFGRTFNPDLVNSYEDQLKGLVAIQDELQRNQSQFTSSDYSKLTSQLKAYQTGLVATRDILKANITFQDEAGRNVERNARQASRVAVQESKAATGRYVVDAQSQAAAARDSARQQIESTRASSRQRVAIIQAAARTISTIERGLSTIFRGTAQTVQAAFRGISTTATGIASGFRRVITNNNSKISQSYNSTFKNATNSVRNETNQQTSIIRNFAREASSSIGGISAGGLALGGLAALGLGKALTGGFERATTIETANRGLEVLLGNADEAKKLLDEVVGVVTGTPFALDQFAEGAARLVAFNVQADKIPGILSAAGDAAALSGKNASQVIDTLIRVTGQATATGKLYGDSILSLGDAGIPALRILGNAFNKQTGDIQELLTNGVIPAEEALDALFKGIVEGTDGINGTTKAFGGLAKSLGDTLSGSLSNFNIAFARFGANLFKVFTPSIVAAAKAGTAAVDLIGVALASLANSIQSTPVFGILQRGVEAFGRAATDAKSRLKPLFDFVADGIVVFAQFAAAVFTLRRIPLVVGLVTAAFRRLFTPLNLLIATGVAVGGFLQRVVEGSTDLRTALARLGSAVGRIGTVVSDLAVEAFEALSIAIDRFVTPAVTFLADQVLKVAIPALERLSDFLVTKVLPPIRRFAKFVRTEVLPVIGERLERALEIGRGALAGFVEFVTAAFEILTRGGTTLGSDGWLAYDGPVVKALFRLRGIFKETFAFIGAAATILWRGEEYTTGTGWLSEDGVVVQNLVNIRNTFEAIERFVKSNLTPVIAGLGAAFGTLALSGGNLPLAGLVGLTTGAVLALRNDEVRNALVDTIKGAVERARVFLKNLIDGGVLADIAVGALKIANTIGRVLGDILSDRRLVTAVAGIVAFGAAVAVSFVAGFAEGIISNIPELISAIGDGLKLALTEAIKALGPVLATLVAGLFAGAAVLAAAALAGRKVGTTFALAASDGITKKNVPLRRGNFFSTLFGGSESLDKQIEREFRRAQDVTIREKGRLQRLLFAGTGSVATGKNGLEATPKQVTKQLAAMDAQIGRTNAAAIRFKQGFADIRGGLRNFPQDARAVTDGLRSVGEGFKLIGPDLGARAGILAGGAFAASFVSRALFDIEASGKDKLQAGLGTIAIGAATGQQLTGTAQGAAVGAGLGVLAIAVGLLTTRIDENKEAFERATVVAESYAAALDGVTLSAQTYDLVGRSSATSDALIGQFRDNLADVPEIVATLDAAGFTIEQLEKKLTGKTTGGEFFAGVRRQLREANIEGEEFDETITFLEDQLAGFGLALDTKGRLDNIFSSAALDAEEAAAASGIATNATQAFTDKVTELNDARLDGFRSRLSEAREDLGLAEAAADSAKQALIELLNPPPPVEGQAAIDQTIVAIDGIGSSISELVSNNPLIAFAEGVDASNVRQKLGEIGDEVAGLLADAPDKAAAEAIATDLKAGLEGEDYGQAVIDIINAQLAAFDREEVQAAAGNVATAMSEAIAEAADVAAAENALQTALDQNPLDLPGLRALAEAEFKAVGEAGIAGLAEGYRDNPEARTAATEMALETLAAAAAALGVESPSTKFAEMGRFAVLGFIQGFNQLQPTLRAVTLIAGRQAMLGFQRGIESGSAGVIAAATAVANAVVRTIRLALQIESPSKVMAEIGGQTIEGFIVGIDDSLPLVDRIAFTAASRVVGKFAALGTAAARAVGTGFAEGGPSFVSSVSGAMDDAFRSASSKADQFKAIGNQIALNLFQGQGTNAFGAAVAGGGVEAGLQKAFLDIIGSTQSFGETLRKNVEEATNFFGGDAGAGRAFGASLTFGDKGRENQGALLQAGLNIRDYIEQVLASGRSTEVAADAARFQVAQLVAVADAYGISRAEVDKLIETLGLSNSQIDEWVQSVNAVTKATAAATTEAERALAAQKAAERAADDERKRAEFERQRVEDERREFTLPGPTFRDLIIQSPSGDPEAVALATVNRVAFSIRR